MKPELCRRCGKKLSVLKKCIVCSKQIQLKCSSCGYKTEKQIHIGCTPDKLLKKIIK